MKKIIIGLFALASLSTAALASERTDIDPRDRSDVGSSVSAISSTFANDGDTAAFAVPGSGSTVGLSAYERVMLQSINNEDSRNN